MKRVFCGYVNVESGRLLIGDPCVVGVIGNAWTGEALDGRCRVKPRPAGDLPALVPSDLAEDAGQHLYFHGTEEHMPMTALLLDKFGGDGLHAVHAELCEAGPPFLIQRVVIGPTEWPENENEWQAVMAAAQDVAAEAFPEVAIAAPPGLVAAHMQGFLRACMALGVSPDMPPADMARTLQAASAALPGDPAVFIAAMEDIARSILIATRAYHERYSRGTPDA